MPKFTFKAFNAHGQAVEGTRVSGSPRMLRESLEAESLIVLSIEEARGTPARPAPSSAEPRKAALTDNRTGSEEKRAPLSSHKVPPLDELAIMARQLASVLQAGIPFVKGLRIVSESQQSKSALRPVLVEILEMIEGGCRPDKALARFSHVFSPHFISLVTMGMETGRLAESMNTLSSDLEKESELRKKVVAALTYPIFVFVLTIALNAVIFIYIFPKIINVLTEMNVALPFITRCMMVMVKAVTNPAYIVLALSVVIFLMMQVRYYVLTPVGKYYYDRIKFLLPVFGGVNRILFIERFTRTLSILFHYGFRLNEALRITGQVCANDYLKDSLFCEIEERIRNGDSIAEAFRAQSFIPPAVVHMVAAGEEAGDIAGPLKRVSEMYELEIVSILQKVVTLIEPFMILFMSIVILSTILSIMLPLYQVITRLGQ